MGRGEVVALASVSWWNCGDLLFEVPERLPSSQDTLRLFESKRALCAVGSLESIYLFVLYILRPCGLSTGVFGPADFLDPVI